MRRSVELRVGGQTYRVVSSASDEDLRRLAEVVSKKLSSLGSAARGTSSPQSLLLAAIALAHDAEDERSQRRALERKTRDVLRRLLSRVDSALEPLDAVAPRG
jgi:cell division protein ZapA